MAMLKGLSTIERLTTCDITLLSSTTIGDQTNNLSYALSELEEESENAILKNLRIVIYINYISKQKLEHRSLTCL